MLNMIIIGIASTPLCSHEVSLVNTKTKVNVTNICPTATKTAAKILDTQFGVKTNEPATTKSKRMTLNHKLKIPSIKRSQLELDTFIPKM